MDCGGTFKKSSLEEKEFHLLSTYIEDNLGIRMPPAKQVMLESRLQKRLKQLKLGSFKEYTDYLFSKEGQDLELPAMIDVVTTNKTDFYREPAHFRFLQEIVLPEWFGRNGNSPFSVWSAACSTGEEPYTIAMECSQFQEKHRTMEYRVLATDISGEVLEKARKGIYAKDRIEPVSPQLVKRFFLRSKDPSLQVVRIKPELRERIGFMRLNLMSPSFPFRDRFHAVFCRNVMIYFERERQKQLLERIACSLEPGGYLFLGHSETLTGMDVPFRTVAATVYRKI
jgi:chemotaxis protein methyltransferase CheR